MAYQFNRPAPNTSYFTPAQNPPAGTAVDPQPDGKAIPTLFKPLKIRGVEFHNRIFVSINNAELDRKLYSACHAQHRSPRYASILLLTVK